jgi:two-component system chemotaxis response regulator CheY
MVAKKDKGETAMPRARVLVVEGDKNTRELVSQTLTAEGYDVVEVDNVEAGLKAVRHSKGQHRTPDVVLCNRQVSSKNGQDPIMQFLGHRPAIPVVMLADNADLHYATQMFRQGVVDYLVKPVQSNALIDVIQHALKAGKEQSHV